MVVKHPSKQNIKVAVDNCIFTVIDKQLHVLLIKMKKQPFKGKWALPGGLIGRNETLDKAALRMLKAQTGVTDVFLKQIQSFSDPKRDPRGRVVSVAYYALLSAEGIILRTSEKYSDVRWVKVDSKPKLAYDHEKILDFAKTRLQSKIQHTNIAWSLLPEKFVLTELQHVYEAVLEKKLDKRNFRKKILALGLIKETGQKAMRGAHRPAKLYKFVSTKPKVIKVL